MELLPALLCIVIMMYIIYLEFKNPKYGRDIFIDLSITIIVLIVSVFSIYEYKFDFSKTICQLYIGLILIGIFYIGLVYYHEKHPKTKVEDKPEELTQEEVLEDQTNND
ncbi:MAG: hypothetical protein IKC22_04110 [Bacilli bacterium]|nr:hypothetical protein [Bacilli bacterium]